MFGGVVTGLRHDGLAIRSATPTGHAVKDFSGPKCTRWPTRFRPPLPLCTPKGLSITAQERTLGNGPSFDPTLKGLYTALATCGTPSGFVLARVAHPGCATRGRDPGL